MAPSDLSRAYGAATIDHKPGCWRCSRTLFEYAARPWSIRCRRCKTINRSPGEGVPSPQTNIESRP